MIKDTEEEMQKKPIAEQGYSQIYIPEMITSVKNQEREHQTQTSKYTMKKDFTVDLYLYIYLNNQKPHYFNIFKNYSNGATSAAVFGEFFVDKLEPSILQSAFDQTAIDVEHINNFITKEVDKYLLEDKSQEVLKTIKANIKSKGKCVIDAVNKSTEDVNKINGNIDMWLEYFSKELKDELQFKEESCLEQKAECR
ncbi:up-regulator of cell proliferation isoform X2 [Silurus meridionalis]|nr:up-regulator of cell proliferation isoform X2 [Silurus meridionalis]